MVTQGGNQIDCGYYITGVFQTTIAGDTESHSIEQGEASMASSAPQQVAQDSTLAALKRSLEEVNAAAAAEVDERIP